MGWHLREWGGSGFFCIFLLVSVERETSFLSLILRLYGELYSKFFIFHMNNVVKFVSFHVNGLSGAIRRKKVLI